MQASNQDSFPIMSYLKVFFRRKHIIIVVSFIGLVIGICTGMILPRQYESSTVILVEEGKTDNPLFEKLAVSTTVLQRLETIKESMLGWNSIVKLIHRLEMDAEIANAKQLEAKVMSIRKNIDIKMKGHNIIYLSYIGYDPFMTKNVVENITNIFIERNKEIQSQETADAITFIEEQLKVYKGKIKSAEIAKLQDQLDELLIDSTPKHPLVQELQEKVKIKRKELEQEKLPFTDAEVLKLESNKPLIESIKTALAKLETEGPKAEDKVDAKGELYKVMLMDKLENVMARDAAVNESIYNQLLQRLETAKITQRLQASKEGAKYTILDPPRVPLEPSKPNRILLALGGLILGMIIGFAVVFGLEFLDKSFLDVEDAKEFLGVPLLGAISKIQTDESIRLEKEKHRWIYSLTVIFGMIAIAVTFVLADLMK